MDNLLENGERCPGPGQPCKESGCLNCGILSGWHSVIRGNDEGDALADELDRLSTLVLETLGVDAYADAIISANTIGKHNPEDPRAMNLALRDELKRMLGPH